MALVGRTFVIAFAFLLSSLAATVVIAVGVMLPEWGDVLALSIEHGAFSLVVGIGAVYLSAIALLPAVVLIVVAEAMRLRSLLFYAIAGGLGMLALYAAAGFGMPMPDRPAPLRLELIAAAGIVAGLVYWALAGRNAGRWCAPPASVAT